METNEILDQGYQPSNQGGLSGEDKSYLETTAKWAKFLGIVGFVFTGFMILAAFAMFTLGSSLGTALGEASPIMGSMMGVGLGIFYLILGLPYFFISLYTYQFASKTLIAIQHSDSNYMTEGFKNLRNLFRLMGLFTAIAIGLYLLIIVIAIGSAAFAG